MERNQFTFIQMNTSAHLLYAYDELALTIKKKVRMFDVSDPFSVAYDKHQLNGEFIALNLALMNMNAAILEGSLRSLLCEIIQRDSELLGEHSISNSSQPEYRVLTSSYELLKRLQEEVEFQGGWDKLKRQYKEYLGINLDDILDKEKTSAINSIFTLRNIAAHGTSYVIPKHALTDEDKGTYLFKWQSKTQSLTVYTKKVFSLDVLNALKHPCFAYHYLELIKELLNGIQSDKFPPNAKMLLDNIRSYSFGYRNFGPVTVEK
ncbi:hypothetical protein [Vibrio parahaemolyticus]|uniref:hypothetical protein n=1 Tax=Vibrio parahaemolyticus TaxID=670 RepID=UPI000993AB59|nr:hypothetical protein [Vibrio parahaemolyticus]OOQ62925.1 hypothetical protein BSR59_22060 [Vibrio parahaemolyticus]OOQ72825.1 hypothetical protein BSR63_21155 [Vibrio parahaemolyticus]QEL40024.1 DUF736 domain-containing protein [Vibrio parahaemolyticus]